MSKSTIHFSEHHVEEVANQIKAASDRYDKLFSDLGKQIFVDVVDLEDASEIMAICKTHADNAIGFFSKHIPHQFNIACQKGCAYCCHFPVTTPPQVIDDVASFLKEQTEEAQLQVLKKEMESYITTRNGKQGRMKCPCLNTENQCVIYERRPLSCRSFTSSNNLICKASLSDERTIAQDPIFHRIYQAATTALISAQKHHGLDDSQQDFIPALLKQLSLD